MKEELKYIVEEGQELSKKREQLNEKFRKLFGVVDIELAKVSDVREDVLSNIKGWREYWQKICSGNPSSYAVNHFNVKLPIVIRNFYDGIKEGNIRNQEAIEGIEELLQKLES